MHALGEVAFRLELEPNDLFRACAGVRNTPQLYEDPEAVADWYEAFAYDLAEIRSLPETALAH